MGSKGGDSQIEVSDYRMSMHVGLAHSVDAVCAIYYGEKKFWSGYANTNTTLSVSNIGLHGGYKKEGGIQGEIDVLLGGASQVLPDSLATRLGRASGADCPGFRGVTSLFLTGGASRGFYWTTNTPYLKPLWATVLRAPKGLTASKALVGFSNTYIPEFSIGYPYKYHAWDFANTTDCSAEAFDDSEWFNWASSTEPMGASEAIAGDGVKSWVRKPFVLENTDPLIIRLYGKYFATVWVNGVLVMARSPKSGEYNVSVPPSVLRVGSNLLVVLTDFQGYSTPGWPVRTVSPMFRIIEAVQGESGAVTAEANPAHIIYECMTNTDWGMGESPDLMDIGSFEACGNTLFDEGFGLSMIWTRQSTVEDFTNEVLNHINGVRFTNPRTGLHTLRLVRGGYDESSLRDVNPDNASMLRFSRRVWGETTNEMVVTWVNPKTEKEETVSLQDLGNIAMQGAVISASRNYYGVRSSHLAMQLAARELRVAASPLCVCDIELDRSAWDILPADVVALTWPEYGIVDLPMRVGTVDYGRIGESKVKITLVEDVFALPTSHFEEPPSTAFTDIRALPSPVTVSKVFTLPAYASAAIVPGGLPALTYPDAFAGILAKAPSEDAYSFELEGQTANTLGETVWVSKGTRTFTSSGTLVSAISPESTTIFASFADMSGGGPTVAAFGLIGDGDEAQTEIVLFSAYSITTGYTVERGVLDTVPRAWLPGTKVWFAAESEIAYDGTKLSAGVTPQYKLLTNTSYGQLSVSDAPIVSGTIGERPHLPLRPANVKVGGQSFGSLDVNGAANVNVTWSNRNRITEDSVVLGWTDGDTPGEVGQKTKLVVTSDTGTVLSVIPNLTGTLYNLPLGAYTTVNNVRVKVYSEKDGLLSLQAHEIRLTNIGATDTGDIRVTDTGGIRVIHSGEVRQVVTAVAPVVVPSVYYAIQTNATSTITASRLSAPYARKLTSSDNGATWVQAGSTWTRPEGIQTSPYPTAPPSGDLRIGTKTFEFYPYGAGAWNRVVVQDGNAIAMSTPELNPSYQTFPRLSDATGVIVSFSANSIDGTKIYCGGYATAAPQYDGHVPVPTTDGKLRLYETTDGLTVTEIGLLEPDASISTGYLNVFSLANWKGHQHVVRNNGRWFLQPNSPYNDIIYTDQTTPRTGWRECGVTPTGNYGNLAMVFIGNNVALPNNKSWDFDGHRCRFSADNGSTWSATSFNLSGNEYIYLAYRIGSTFFFWCTSYSENTFLITVNSATPTLFTRYASPFPLVDVTRVTQVNSNAVVAVVGEDLYYSTDGFTFTKSTVPTF